MDSAYITEMRLSRAFANEFDKYLQSLAFNITPLPPELLEAYNKLKAHYQFEMDRELS